MFNKLVASSRGKRSFWTPKTITISVGGHALLLAGVVYASVIAPQADDDDDAVEEVTFMDIQEQPEPEPEAPQDEPPPPPEQPPEPSPARSQPSPPRAQPAVPPPPRGFQDLIPPDVAPPGIPDPDLAAAPVLPEDFSGIGQRGGTAEGVEGGVEGGDEDAEGAGAGDADPNFVYQPAVLDRQPELTNTSDVQRALQRLYPDGLMRSGIGGEVVLRFVITAQGRVDPGTIEVVSASHADFRRPSVEAAQDFRFRPGQYQGVAVRVLVSMPIAWQPQD
jgi:protein TonB